MTIIVNCPTCEKEVTWSKASLYRPFCSSRCRLIDLGEWADEKRYIANTEESEYSEE